MFLIKILAQNNNTTNSFRYHSNIYRIIMIFLFVLLSHSCYSLIVLYISSDQYIDDFVKVSLWNYVVMYGTLWWVFTKKTHAQDINNCIVDLINKLYIIFIYNTYTNQLVENELSINNSFIHLLNVQDMQLYKSYSHMLNSPQDADHYIQWMHVQEIYIMWHIEVKILIAQLFQCLQNDNINQTQKILLQIFDFIENCYQNSQFSSRNCNIYSIHQEDFNRSIDNHQDVVHHVARQQKQKACYVLIRHLGVDYVEYLHKYISHHIEQFDKTHYDQLKSIWKFD